MERIRDLRRSSTCSVNGFPKRRQRIGVLGDSAEEDGRIELQETARLRDRERLHKMEFQKRRKVDRSAAALQNRNGGGGENYKENDIITDSSDEGSFEEHRGMDQLSTTNRRGFRNLRSSLVVKVAADEIFGVPIPRRARSITAKKLHEHWNSGAGRSWEDLSNRRFSPAPAVPIDTDSVSPSSFSGSMKKKMKSSSAIQNDIEIEVAEALFDLMKQSRSTKDSTDTDGDDLKMLKAEGSGGDVNNNAFSVQSEPPKEVSAETAVLNEMEKESREVVEREKFPVDTVHELVGGGDGFLNKGKMGSPEESESPSRVKVNACDNQYPTKTKADGCTAIAAWAKNETKLTIDLMALPEETASVDTMAQALTNEVQKGETALEVADKLEKSRRDTAGVSECPTQQLQVLKGQKNQSTSLFPFPISMSSSWPAILPHQCYIPPPQTVLAIDGNARSSTSGATPLPQFKFSQPQLKRCATHQNIANNIARHQQLIKKHLLVGPTETSPGTKPLNLQTTMPPQSFNFGSGKDKHQAPPSNYPHGSGFIVPFGHHQNTMMAASQPASSVGSSASLTSCSPSGKPSVNLSLPVSFNHPIFPSKDTAPPYMAVLQNNGSSIPVPSNFPMPSLREGSLATPFFNSSFYTSPEFSLYSSKQQQQQQQQLSLPYAPVQSSPQNTTELCDPSRPQKTSKISDNKFPPSVAPRLPHPFLLTHPSTKPDAQNNRQSSGVLGSDGLASQHMNFAAIAPFSSIGGGDHHLPQAFTSALGSNYASNAAFNFSSSLKDFQSSEGKCDEKSFNLPRSDCAGRIFNALPPGITAPTSATIPDFHQHLIQLQKKHQVNGSAPRTIIPGSFLPKWENFPRPTAPEGPTPTHINLPNSLALQGQHTVSKNVNKGAAAVHENGISQKSSPVCRRNVPPILSTHASQLSELKY